MTVVLIVSTGIVGASAALHNGSSSSSTPLCAGARSSGPTVADQGAVNATVPAGALPPKLVAQPTRLQLLPVFRRWASICAVPASLIEATCWWESGWQENVVSATGAVGVCQIEPGAAQTVRRLLDDPTLDPGSSSDNIEMSAAYLRWLLDQTGGRRDLALAGYYQGPTSVREHGILAVSRPYVSGIDALLHDYTWA
jgi:soluble lytic murein transglycosylase-like protein